MPRAANLVLGLLGLGAVATGTYLFTRPTPPAPAHYRVRLERPPVEAALWFVARYPEYFTSGEAGFEAWLDELHEGDREFVLAMGQTLVWAWVEHELADFEGHSPQALAHASIAAVRGKTLNQLEYDLEGLGDAEDVEFVTYVGEPMFAPGVFGRLVRGASNCEGQNHLAAVLLDAALDPGLSWVPQLEVFMVGIPDGHELAWVSGPSLAQPIFVDAWSNLPAFTIDPSTQHEAPLLAELGDPPPSLVWGAEGRDPRPAEDYAMAEAVQVRMVPGRWAPTKAVDLDVRPPSLELPSLAKIESPWELYLLARVLHIYDDPRAALLYAFLLEHHCDSIAQRRAFVCTASTLLSDRLAMQ